MLNDKNIFALPIIKLQMFRKKWYVFLIVSFTSILGFSQDSLQVNNVPNSYPTIRFSYGHGRVLATNDFLRTANKNQSPITQQRNISAEVIFQTTGKKDWYQLFGFPKLGLGFQQSWYPQTNELGSPIALYAIIESPIHKWKNAQLDWGFHFGVNMNWNPYNSETNPNNLIIGSKATFYAHFGIIYHQNIGERFGLDASIGMTHASNGAVKMPNAGINIFDPRIAITYDLQNEKPKVSPRKLTDFHSSNELSLSYAIGTKQLGVINADSTSKALFGDKNFTIYNFVLLYQRQVSRLSRVGAGIDFTVDPADNANGIIYGDKNSTYPAPFNEQAKLALILSYELCLDRLSLILQPGFYFYRTTHDPKPFFYQRIGVRYQIYKGLYTGASLRAVNFGQADWIEFTIGYKLKF